MPGLHLRSFGRLLSLLLLGGACNAGPEGSTPPGSGTAADSPTADSPTADSPTADGPTADSPGDPDSSGPDTPPPPLPTPTAECPEFVDGMVTFTVDGVSRQARVWIDPTASAAMDGPVVLYWYGTGGQPTQAQNALGDGLSTITARGGLVVAPVHTGGGPFPWLEDSEADHRLTDEVVACADQALGIDAHRIHSLGFSAGGLFTTSLSFARSSYVASVATYSGGGTGTLQDPSSAPAAMILHGGPSDEVSGFNFLDASVEYQQALSAAGGSTLLCDHGSGHTIPGGVGPAVVQFWLDHPFGQTTSPYTAGLPSVLPAYCTIP
ncbi:MAG: hypothetical protein AAGF11_50925 [Myxococcota bacterium]